MPIYPDEIRPSGFRKEEEERAVAILKQCEGLSIAHALSLLNRCGEALLKTTIGRELKCEQ